jgi:hypothetical protein
MNAPVLQSYSDRTAGVLTGYHSMAGGFKLPHSPFSFSSWLMRILGTVV